MNAGTTTTPPPDGSVVNVFGHAFVGNTTVTKRPLLPLLRSEWQAKGKTDGRHHKRRTRTDLTVMSRFATRRSGVDANNP